MAYTFITVDVVRDVPLSGDDSGPGGEIRFRLTSGIIQPGSGYGGIAPVLEVLDLSGDAGEIILVATNDPLSIASDGSGPVYYEVTESYPDAVDVTYFITVPHDAGGGFVRIDDCPRVYPVGTGTRFISGVTLASILALFTAPGQLLVGTGDGDGELLNPGTDDQVLKLISGLPSWQDEAGGALTLADLNPIFGAEGELLFSPAINVAALLSPGVDGKILGIVGGLPAWVAAPGGGSSVLVSHYYAPTGAVSSANFGNPDFAVLDDVNLIVPPFVVPPSGLMIVKLSFRMTETGTGAPWQTAVCLVDHVTGQRVSDGFVMVAPNPLPGQQNVEATFYLNSANSNPPSVGAPGDTTNQLDVYGWVEETIDSTAALISSGQGTEHDLDGMGDTSCNPFIAIVFDAEPEGGVTSGDGSAVITDPTGPVVDVSARGFAPVTLLDPTTVSIAGQFIPTQVGGATFVAKGTTARFTLSGAFNGTGGGNWFFSIIVGENGGAATTPLIAGQVDATSGGNVPAAGATILYPGQGGQPINSYRGLIKGEGAVAFSSELVLPGLTVGTEYTVQVYAFPISSEESSVLPVTPLFMAMAPDFRTVWCCDGTAEIVPVTVGLKPFYSFGVYQDLTLPPAGEVVTLQYTETPVALPSGMASFDVAFGPPGTTDYGIVSGLTSDKATVFNWATKAIVGTVTLGASAIGVCVDHTGTTGYVALANGTVVPVTLATATAGTPVTVVTGHTLYGICVDHAGTHLWVADNTAHTITPITIAGMVVGTPVALGAAPTRVHPSSDGSIWVTCGDVVHQISGGAIVFSFDPGVANGFATGHYGAVVDFMINEAGTAMWWWTATDMGDVEVATGAQWYAPGGAGGLSGTVCMSTDGYEYVYFGKTNGLGAFLCSKTNFGVANSFGNLELILQES